MIPWCYLSFYSPVVEREEVFLGNVLLNDFLNKAVVDAVKTLGGQVAPVIQDLENGFVLLRSQQFDVVVFAKEFRQTVQERLPDLLLGHENLEQGIHGDVNQMLTFYKSNIEPFPIFILPREKLPRATEDGGKLVAYIVRKWWAKGIGRCGPYST